VVEFAGVLEETDVFKVVLRGLEQEGLSQRLLPPHSLKLLTIRPSSRVIGPSR
jgi:hypothetical protein